MRLFIILISIFIFNSVGQASEDAGWARVDAGGSLLSISNEDSSKLIDATSLQINAVGVPRENIDLFAGEIKVIKGARVKRVAIGNGGIIRAEVLDSGELLVIAKTAGSTSLRLWHNDKRQSDYNIRVSEQDPERRFPIEKMIRMKVKMVEFRKNALGKVGIDWSQNIAGPTFSTVGDIVGNSLYRPESQGFPNLPNNVKPFSTYFGIASSITSRINLMASSGDALTLAEPVLSCANGSTAQFLAGGEVPYTTIGSSGEPIVAFKDYGIKLQIAPEIDSSGNIRTLIDTEISQLDPALSVQGTPGLLTRRAQTQVNVRSGETIVISGLLSTEKSIEQSEVPFLGQLPYLGQAFRSKSTRSTVRELVIFVTPEVMEAGGVSEYSREGRVLKLANSQLNNLKNSTLIME